VPLYVREVLHAVPRESLRAALSAPDIVLPALQEATRAGLLAAAHPVAGDLAGYAGTEPALLGFWPLYAHALARTGRLADAAGALAPFAELAAARGRRSAIAAAARVQGFIHAAARRPAAARDAPPRPPRGPRPPRPPAGRALTCQRRQPGRHR
jgi:hypothetical protein